MNILWTDILHYFRIYNYRTRRPSGDILVKCVRHRERTPSLMLYKDSGVGKCYGCGWRPSKSDLINKLTGHEEIPWELSNPNYYFYPDDQMLFGFMERIGL